MTRIRVLLEQVLSELWLLAGALAGLVWPVSCAGCGAPGGALCPSCQRCLAGEPFRHGSLALPVWALSAYGGTAAGVIVSWKEHGRPDLSGPLGQALARAVMACLAHDVPSARGQPGQLGQPGPTGQPAWPGRPGAEIWLVPMPASRAALRRRGVDLPFELARAAARGSSNKAGQSPPIRAVRVLTHARKVRDQVGLAADDRRRNLRGALMVRRKQRRALTGRVCVVVDDIVTTGASAAEATRVLTESGAQVVGVCCLSVTFHRQGVLTASRRTSLAAWKAPSGR